MSFLYLACVILFSAIAQLLFKLFFIRNDRRYVVFALPFFGLVPLMSYLTLKSLSLGTVYMSTALTIVLVLLSSRIILKEPLPQKNIFASLLIVSGVIIFNL